MVGDLIHDVIVIPQGEIRANTDTAASIHKSMGGAAANVASWLAHFGVQVTFVACVSRSEASSLAGELEADGIETRFQLSDKPSGSLVVLVEGESRSMLTDRGANSDLVLGEIDPAGYSVVYLSGYALLGKSQREISSLISRSKKAGALVAVDPGSTGFISDFGVSRFRELISHADVVFPNLEEEQLLEISGKVPLAVVTLGERGAKAIANTGTVIEAESPDANMVDPTGAGDAFCAGFLAEMVKSNDLDLTSGELIAACLSAAVEAGSMAAGRIGARP